MPPLFICTTTIQRLHPYRAICTRAARYLGRPARVEDLTDEFVAGWLQTIHNPGARKIAKAIIHACRRVVFRETTNSTHPVFWTESQRNLYLSHVGDLKGRFGVIPRSLFWQCFASIAADLGWNLIDLRELSKLYVWRHAARLSATTVQLLDQFPVRDDEPLFVQLTRDRLVRKHRELCWSSGIVVMKLSTIEIKIAELISKGSTVNEIRSRLEFSEHQLKHYCHRISKISKAVQDRRHRKLLAHAASRGLVKTRQPTLPVVTSLCDQYCQAGDSLIRAPTIRGKVQAAFINCSNTWNSKGIKHRSKKTCVTSKFIG